VWVAGKIVGSRCYTRAISERIRDKEIYKALYKFSCLPVVKVSEGEGTVLFSDYIIFRFVKLFKIYKDKRKRLLFYFFYSETLPGRPT